MREGEEVGTSTGSHLENKVLIRLALCGFGRTKFGRTKHTSVGHETWTHIIVLNSMFGELVESSFL